MDTHTLVASPASSGGVRKLRLLGLHSFRTSAKIFQEQVRRSKLDVQLQDLVDIVYIDAPHLASGRIPNDVVPYFDGPYYEWFTAEDMGDRVQYDDAKVLHSHEYVTKVLLEQGPFDGIISFSQGSVLGSALIAMQQHGTLLQGVPKLRFGIFFSAMKSRYPMHMDAMQTKVSVPALHITGEKDQLLEHGKELAVAFSNSTLMVHPRGHIVPPLSEQHLAMTRAFLTTFLHAPAPRL